MLKKKKMKIIFDGKATTLFNRAIVKFHGRNMEATKRHINFHKMFICSGIYEWYHEDLGSIYVGKSIQMNKRLLGHHMRKYPLFKELKIRIYKSSLCGVDLLDAESDMILRKLPLMNREIPILLKRMRMCNPKKADLLEKRYLDKCKKFHKNANQTVETSYMRSRTTLSLRPDLLLKAKTVSAKNKISVGLFIEKVLERAFIDNVI